MKLFQYTDQMTNSMRCYFMKRMKAFLPLAFAVCLAWNGQCEAAAEELISEGQTYISKREYAEAFSCYDRAIQENAELAAAYDGRARAVKHMGKIEECLKDLATAITLEPQNARFLLHRGMVYQEYNMINEAEADYLKVIELAPTALDPLMSYISLLQDAERYADALPLADKMESLLDRHGYQLVDLVSVEKEEEAAAYLLIGSIYHHLPDGSGNKRALEICNKALQLDSQFNLCYYLRASVYKALNKYTEALKDCNEVRKLSKEREFLGMASYIEADCYNKLGDYQTALKKIEEGIEVFPNGASSYVVRADIYLSLGEKEKAKADVEKFLSLGGKENALSGKLLKLIK